MHEIVKTGHRYPEIVFLCTGSVCPNKRRNASDILIHINGRIYTRYTIGLIRHIYSDQSDRILSRIRFVYISQQCRYVYENLGRKYEKLTLIRPNKYVDVGRNQWNYFSDEYEFDNDVHVVFNRTLTNIGRKI
ncbi:unnamed protein product, partial [Rotaria sp. Silwood2]